MSGHEPSADINSLQEALAQQQQKITALREMVRKSDNAQSKSSNERSSTTEKVKNITKQLKQLKAKAQGSYYSGDGGEISTKAESVDAELETQPTSSQVSTALSSLQYQLSVPNASTTGSEKVALLRQQMEQNKLRLAQRASSKLHLEQMVSDLKEKLDSTQQCLEDTSELGKSMTDLSIYATLSRSAVGAQQTIPATSTMPRHDSHRHRSATDLSTQPAFNLEKERIKFLENRCRLLEKQLEKERQAASSAAIEASQHVAESETSEQLKQNKELENRVLELESLLQERQQEIEAKAINEQDLTTETERLRNELAEYLNKGTSDSQDDHEKTTKPIEYEELEAEISRLSKRVAELEEVNDVLETARCDLSAENNEYKDKLKNMEEELSSTEQKLENLTTELNEVQRKYLELQTEKDEREVVASTVGDTLSEDTESGIKAEMAKQIQELQDVNQQLTTDNSQLKESIADHEKLEVNDDQITAKINNLEATIESQREDLTARQETIKKLEEELMEKTIELNVLNANFGVVEEKLQALNKTKSKPLFSTTAGGANEEANADLEAEVQQLKQKLDESNKAMIKLKLKCKQSEKQIEKLKKSSKLHEELIEQQKSNEQLQQRITELEDEKGQWQLSQMDEGDNSDTRNTQTETIRLLEQQKYEQLQQIESLQQELDVLRQQAQSQERVVIARVESQLSEIQLEEQLDQQKQEINNLQQQIKGNDKNLNALQQQVEDLQLDKQNLEKKLEHYLSENMELLDKVDKLSKSSSSAESIEIVDRLTQQERAEIDEFNKRLEQRGQQQSSHEDHPSSHPTSVSEVTQTEMGFELSESLVKLREESSELMNKVAMFTSERREVLEKMENLNAENQELQQRIDELTEQKADMEHQVVTAEEAKNKLETELQVAIKEKELLSTQVAESTAQKAQLSRELTSMQKSSEIVAALDNNEGCVTLFDKCEKSLVKLDAELEAYRRANDKNAKFNASKKLAKEAKNAHTQLSELLLKVKEASTAVETVTVVETVVAVTAPNGKALAEYEQLTAQNRELKVTVDELRSKLEELEDTSVHDSISEMVDVKPTTAAIKIDSNREEENVKEKESLLNKLREYEDECNQMRKTVDDLSSQLSAVNISNEAKTGEITRLNEELVELRKISEDFDRLMNDKEMSHEQQIEKFTKIRKELEGKCEVYENEMEILQTLVTEQKQQLIEAYKEHEHETNLKLLDLQQRDEQLLKLRTELTELRQTSRAAGAELSDNLEKECEKLRESLRINKTLTAEQINDLANKQETIDMLNQQIIELYKTMEENANKVIEKEDEIADMEETLNRNKLELERVQKDNEEQKTVVDKLLSELHTHKEYKQQLRQLESELSTVSQAKLKLENVNKDLEKRNKEQLEKMKKFAANLKKRAAQCQELEGKIKEMESKTSDNVLQQDLAANVVLLNERITDYELKIKTQETHIVEIQEALQAKTIEILESMENNDKLEHELKELQNTLAQRDEAIVQLQNALAASQEQTAVASDWGDTAFGESSSELEKSENDLLQTRELLREKEQALNELNDVIQQHFQNELTMKQRLIELQTQVDNNQLKASGSGTGTELQTHVEKLKHVEEELSAKSLKFEKSKAVIKERNNQIQRLQAQIKELQHKLAAQPEEIPIESVRVEAPMLMATPPAPVVPTVPKSEHDALQLAFAELNTKYDNEKSTFEATIARLETLHDGIQAKLQEDMSYIETLEFENSRFKDKICKLEECVGSFEERRASMERRANLLDAQLQTRADEYGKAEDELIYRLNMLSEHDEVIGQRLLESQEEKDDLQERLDKLHREFSEISTKYSKLEKEHKNLVEQSKSQLDTELQSLRQRLEAQETESSRMRATFDAKLAAKTTEIDELESELSDQLARINAEKRALQEELEKSNDNCSALKDEIVRVNESLNAVEQAKQESERELTWLRLQNDNAEQDQYELQELRMQSMQDKTELDNLRQQIDTLANNHHAETDALRLQIAELDSLRMQVGQNQTDDQVFIESENKRLSDLLNEKEAIIAEYQRQNLQLQMSAPGIMGAARNPQQPPDLFASIGSEAIALQPPSNQNRNPILEQDLAEKTSLIARLQSEMENLREGNSDLQRQLRDKSQELETLRSRVPAIENPLPAPMSISSNEMIAPPMFFSSSQIAPSPFDEIVQRRHEQPQYSAAPNMFAVEQPTIEDLQRNVSDLEKYAQELENKLSTRNTTEDDLRQRLNEALARHTQTEEQMQVANRHLQEFEQLRQQHTITQSQLEERIVQLEVLLKERDEQLQKAASTASDIQVSAQLIADMENRVKELEQALSTRDIEISELRHELDSAQKLQETTKLLESQIIAAPTSAVDESDAVFKRSVAPSLDMFFGNSTAASSSAFEDVIVPPPPHVSEVSHIPVVENVIVPEKAYICHPRESGATPASNTFNIDLGDDSWGGDDAHWGAPETTVEVAHFAQTSSSAVPSSSLLSREQQLELDLQMSNDRFKELEAALKESDAQKQKLQEKLAKSMKVVGKYKAQNEELKRREQPEQSNSGGGGGSGGFFDDLDAAIQDELRNQIKKLEVELEEQHKSQREAAAEKEKLLKRIDVLSAGNDRMTEMKERQDNDMEMYKTRINELQRKLNKLEDWGVENDEASSGVSKAEKTKISEDTDANGSKLQDLESRIKTLTAEVDDLNGDKHELQALLDEERTNLNRAERLRQDAQSQLSELRDEHAKVCAELGELKEKQATLHGTITKLQKELEEAKRLSESSRSEVSQSYELKQQYQELETKLHTEQQRFDEEKAALAAQQQEMQNEIEKLRTDLETANRFPPPTSGLDVTSNSTRLTDELAAQLQERDDEIVHLKQRIEDLMREDQTEKLVMEILTKNQEIHMLKMQNKHLEDDKHELENNLTLQITKEMQQKQRETDEDVNSKAATAALEKVKELEAQLKELQAEKQQMEEELSVLNSHVMSSLEMEDKLKAAVLDVDMKNIEIKELRQSLDTMRNNTVKPVSEIETTPTTPQVDITTLNARWEAIVEQRCSEIAQMWRTHLEQRENEFQTIEQRLKLEIETMQKSNLAQTTQQTATPAMAQPPQRSISIDTSAAGSASSTPVSTVSATSPSASAESSSADASKDCSPLHIINEADADEIIAKMQTALENQEMEIVSLKEQLAIRSAEYARLAAQYDPFKLQSGSTSSNLESPRTGIKRSNDSVVPKSELDLALYMLHQRDMRCEEMTVELVALLEERDTLQLKLSNTLRQVEAIKVQTTSVEPYQNNYETTGLIPGALSTTQSADSPMKSLSTTSAEDNEVELHQKLSQLQTVNHSKDKLIKEEREHRNRQMERIQQDVANIPTAAVSELIGTDISQTSQSPSSVLMNWLWGNKPPAGEGGGAMN